MPPPTQAQQTLGNGPVYGQRWGSYSSMLGDAGGAPNLGSKARGQGLTPPHVSPETMAQGVTNTGPSLAQTWGQLYPNGTAAAVQGQQPLGAVPPGSQGAPAPRPSAPPESSSAINSAAPGFFNGQQANGTPATSQPMGSAPGGGGVPMNYGLALGDQPSQRPPVPPGGAPGMERFPTLGGPPAPAPVPPPPGPPQPPPAPPTGPPTQYADAQVGSRPTPATAMDPGPGPVPQVEPPPGQQMQKSAASVTNSDPEDAGTAWASDTRSFQEKFGQQRPANWPNMTAAQRQQWKANHYQPAAASGPVSGGQVTPPPDLAPDAPPPPPPPPPPPAGTAPPPGGPVAGGQIVEAPPLSPDVQAPGVNPDPTQGQFGLLRNTQAWIDLGLEGMNAAQRAQTLRTAGYVKDASGQWKPLPDDLTSEGGSTTESEWASNWGQGQYAAQPYYPGQYNEQGWVGAQGQFQPWSAWTWKNNQADISAGIQYATDLSGRGIWSNGLNVPNPNQYAPLPTFANSGLSGPITLDPTTNPWDFLNPQSPTYINNPGLSALTSQAVGYFAKLRDLESSADLSDPRIRKEYTENADKFKIANAVLLRYGITINSPQQIPGTFSDDPNQLAVDRQQNPWNLSSAVIRAFHLNDQSGFNDWAAAIEYQDRINAANEARANAQKGLDRLTGFEGDVENDPNYARANEIASSLGDYNLTDEEYQQLRNRTTAQYGQAMEDTTQQVSNLAASRGMDPLSYAGLQREASVGNRESLSDALGAMDVNRASERYGNRLSQIGVQSDLSRQRMAQKSAAAMAIANYFGGNNAVAPYSGLGDTSAASYAAALAESQDPETGVDPTQSAISGGVAGAGAGAPLGPWGAVIGGVVGAGAGYWGASQ